MKEDRCTTGGSLFGSNCNWIIIVVVIFIIISCCCNNKTNDDDYCYQNNIF